MITIHELSGGMFPFFRAGVKQMEWWTLMLFHKSQLDIFVYGRVHKLWHGVEQIFYSGL